MGNGDEASGDGAKFCGRGYIQLTGKTNYQAFFKSMELDVNSDPTLVATKYALASAAWFWSKNGLNKLADGGATEAVVTSITKRVNGGTIGLSDRILHFNEFYALVA
jgi:putative chitinase